MLKKHFHITIGSLPWPLTALDFQCKFPTFAKAFKRDGRAMKAAVTDILDRKFAEEKDQNLESQFQKSQLMETIATLAGGIAHQFNNALTGVTGNIELLEIALAANTDTDKYFERIKAIIRNMTHLTDQLLAYAQGGKYQPKLVSLNELVKETLPMIHHGNNTGIHIMAELEQNIPYIKADFTQMQMVISSIVANSVEAISGTGRIRISTNNKIVCDRPPQYYPGLIPGRYACLVIEDDGKGMSEDTRSRIFEPFFTTKFQGRGLSMAAVYGIIKNHNGWIWVDSELGKGTAIQIFLPASEIGSEKLKEPESEINRGEGTILVIEDENTVMEVSCAMLEALGYQVIGANTGKEAVHVAGNFAGHIDLALLDIGLPDMGGDYVYPLLKKIRPNTKVIVCSGYAVDGPAQKIMDSGAQGFLQKPYSLAVLSTKLKEVLDSV